MLSSEGPEALTAVSGSLLPPLTLVDLGVLANTATQEEEIGGQVTWKTQVYHYLKVIGLYIQKPRDK